MVREERHILAKGVVQCLRPEKKTGPQGPVVKQPPIKENTDANSTEEGCYKEIQTTEGANKKLDHDGDSQENDNNLKETSVPICESNIELGTNTTYERFWRRRVQWE